MNYEWGSQARQVFIERSNERPRYIKGTITLYSTCNVRASWHVVLRKGKEIEKEMLKTAISL